MFQDPGTIFQESGTLFQELGTLFQDSGTVFQDPGTLFQDPGTLFHDPRALSTLSTSFETVLIAGKNSDRINYSITLQFGPAQKLIM